MTTETSQGLLQLAQYQPFRDGGATREETFRQMIAPILMEAGGRLDGPEEICEAFQALFTVEVEPEELEGWLERLEQKGAIERDGGAIQITPAARKLMEDRRKAFEEVSTTAKQEWRATLLGIEPALTDEDLDCMCADLDQLIGLVVAYHGAEAAVILYPEEERSAALRDTLRAKTETLTKRGADLDQIRHVAIAKFFNEPTEAQRKYLADRLDHGFFATVGTLHPDAAKAVREELRGQRLYLDTNILIGAFGLAGRQATSSNRRLLELSRDLGLEPAVTSQTVEEFRHSLERAKTEITQRGIPSRRYASVMRDAAARGGGINLIEGYFESYAEQGSQPDEWFRRAAQFEPLLEELGISIVDDGLAAVIKNEGERINEYVVLLNREAAFRKGRPRDDLPMQHDAIHRRLIEKLRGDSHRRFGTAQYWFLTEDKILARFGQLSLDGEPPPEIPFCITGSAWRQLARCYTPRTDDYDQTITDLLASPYLRFGGRRDLGDLQQAVARISTLIGDDGSPAVVAACINDEAIEAVATGADPEAQDAALLEAYRRAEDRLAKRMVALQERVQSAEAAFSDEREKGLSAVAETEEERAGREALERELKERERQLDESEDALRRERSSSAAEIDRLKREKAEEEELHAQKSEQDKRLALGGLGILTILTLLVLGAVGVLSPAVALVGTAALVSLLIAPRLEGSKWAWRIGFALAVVAVVLAAIPLFR